MLHILLSFSWGGCSHDIFFHLDVQLLLLDVHCGLSLIPRPSHHPGFDRLQYAKTFLHTGGKAWERGYVASSYNDVCILAYKQGCRSHHKSLHAPTWLRWKLMTLLFVHNYVRYVPPSSVVVTISLFQNTTFWCISSSAAFWMFRKRNWEFEPKKEIANDKKKSLVLVHGWVLNFSLTKTVSCPG